MSGVDAAAVEKALAVRFCNALTDWKHHDQTDDHPCSQCQQYAAVAAAALAPLLPQAQPDDEAVRAAVLDEVEQRLAALQPGLREPDLRRAWEYGTNQALRAVRELRAALSSPAPTEAGGQS